jgi:mannosyltransferase
MKIVYDNIIYALQKAGGISVYWSELSKRIAKYAVDFYGYDCDNIFYKNENIVQSQESFLPIKLARYLSFQKRLPKGTIFHSSYYRIANQKDVANIVTVYDFTYEKYRTGLARYVHSWQKKRAINKSDGIVCISHSTKQDLLQFYPNIKEDKIKVIYLGADENFELLKFPKDELKKVFKELIDKKYVLYVGDRSNYKNFDIAVKTTEQIHPEGNSFQLFYNHFPYRLHNVRLKH